jgi:hypothetical protein
MKSPRFPRRPAVLGFVVAAYLPLGLVAASESAPSPRTHVLFMGADLSVQRDKKLYLVEDVTGSEFKIHVNGEDVLIRTRQGRLNLHVDADLKLSGLSVQLDDLKAGPGYTHGNDPMRKLEEATRNAVMMADQADNAEYKAVQSQANLAAAKNNAAMGGYGTAERAQREVAEAETGVHMANQHVDYTTLSSLSDSSNLGSGANRMALAQGNFDAMEVSFKVSSPVALEHPYMVVLFKFHDPAAKPDVNGLVIHAQALDPIDAKPRYVRVLQGGLPLGFKFVDCSVHIYNRGKELATNKSDKRVELTRDEARQYLVLQYCGENKGATLPAAAMRGILSPAQRQALTRAQLTRSVYTKVAKDGVVQGIYSDKDCTVPLDDAGTTTVMGELFFMPALEQGKPVDGVARVRLADI